MTIKSYYNYSRLFSYNAVMNGVIGGRGLGKTYGAKKKAIKDGIKFKGESQFIYLRRYKPELKMSRDTFFTDIQHEFPEYEFRVHGIEAQYAPESTKNEKKREWTTIGFFIPLVSAQSYKSVAFPNVKLIIFDEFIIEKGAVHYLPSEAKVFLNFFSTVDRYKDKTRVLFLANSVVVTNPYFIEYKIEPKSADNDGFVKMFDGFMLWHFPESNDFESEVYQTKFGKFIAGTEYADFAVGNQFIDNHEGLVGPKPSSAKYRFTLETIAGTFSVWYDMASGNYFCQQKRPKVETIITMIKERMDEERTLMNFSDKPMSMLRTAFRHGRTFFDSPASRNAFLEIFKR